MANEPKPIAIPVRSPKELSRVNRMRGFYQSLGFRIDGEQSGVGYCTVAGRIRARHLNVNGVVHGGVYASILDTAMGGAVVTTLAEGETTATTSLYVEFLRGARVGAELRARGDLLRRGRHLAFVEGNLYDASGRRLSQAHGTWYIWSADLPPRSGRPASTRPSRPVARTARRS